MLECGLRAVVLHDKGVVWNYYAECTADSRRINTNQKNFFKDYGNFTDLGSISKALEQIFSNSSSGSLIFGVFFFNGQYVVLGYKYPLGNYGHIDAKRWDGTHWFLSCANGAFTSKNVS